MTTPGDPRTGRAWMALVAYVIQRDGGLCWRCGHPGADTGGHILPIKTHRHLALNPDNLRAEHGKRRTLDVDGYDCIGNYAAGADTGITNASPLEAQRVHWDDWTNNDWSSSDSA